MIFTMILTVLGLCLFEIISSIDNAVINAEILGTMSKKSRRWFLLYGFFFAVFVVRGLLPWAIIWATVPSLGPIGALTAAFSNDPSIHVAVEQASPILLLGGGVFLVFLFFHWLFLESKNFGLRHEKFFLRNGVWFFAVVSILLAIIVWYSIKIDPMLAFAAVIGSTAFFITHGFKENAEKGEKELLSGSSKLSDISKILYLEIIDMTFSVDGVLGAFAFTLSVPLIILGNGLGAFVLRKLTINNIDRIKKYIFLKNGAMYSIFVLGVIMMMDAFGIGIPDYVSPIVTFLVIGFFIVKSIKFNK
ncbi:MAG: DUF475 domain-containing protein [Candidatus Moranbacteria bacterium]|nr:DUF475 domain-containing protein [Candidatus Moranbacteria bacterium]